MGAAKKWIAVSAVALLAILIHRIVLLILVFDFLKGNYHSHKPGPCRTIDGVEYGSEDMQALPNGWTFITSGGKFEELVPEEKAKRKGQILFFDFNKPTVAFPLKLVGDKLNVDTFSPHGLSVWQDPVSGSIFLFTINHSPGEEKVEKFKFDADTKTLKHLKSVTSPVFRCTNDVVALNEDTFYLTNIFHYGLWDILLGFHWGSVVYYDGHEARYVITGLHGPNGFNKKNDHLYIGMSGKSILVLKIEKDHSLTKVQDLWVGSSCDNVDVSVTTGDIWTGCHPVAHILYLNGYMTTPSQSTAPAQVLRFKTLPNGTLDSEITEVYADSGKHFSASSIAVSYGNHMLVGSIYTKLLYCEVVHV